MPAMKRFLAVTIGLACGALAGTASAGPLDDPGFAKSLTCSACHGAAGNSRSDFMPIIAGMSPAYFKKQIEAYAGAKRPSPEMEPYAKMVLVLGVDEVARYFGEQKMQPTPIAVDAGAVARGRAAAAQCATCHGRGRQGQCRHAEPEPRRPAPGISPGADAALQAGQAQSGDAALKAMKAMMLTIPDGTFTDLAAYYSSLR